MKATLQRGQGGLYYELIPLFPNGKRLTREDRDDKGRPIRVPVDSRVFQSDWDYPGLASTLGWSVKDVQREYDSDSESARVHACEHDGTDGTVACKVCNLQPGDFIAFATDWLDEHDGEEFDLESIDDYFAGE